MITKLTQLYNKLKYLAWTLSALASDQREAVKFYNEARDKGYIVWLGETSVELLPSPTHEVPPWPVCLETAYRSAVNRLAEATTLKRALQSDLAQLPEPIVKALPRKEGSPWRSYYNRLVFDVMETWPEDLDGISPRQSERVNVADSLRVRGVTPRGYPTCPMSEYYDHWSKLLYRAAMEVASLRFDVEGNSSEPQSHVPSTDTFQVIQWMRDGLDNEAIRAQIQQRKLKVSPTDDNLRKIRSRYKSRKYTLA